MVMGLYSLYDRVADEFGPPYTAPNDGVAIRMTKQMLSKSDYPNDYWLYIICQYETSDFRIHGRAKERILWTEEELETASKTKEER